MVPVTSFSLRGAFCLTSIVAVLVKTDEHVTPLQLLLCKLQQKGETGKKHSKPNMLMNYGKGVRYFSGESLFMSVEA